MSGRRGSLRYDRSMSRDPAPRSVVLLLGAALALLVTTAAPAAVGPDEDGILVGPVERQEVEQARPDWVSEEVESHPDAASARALTEVPAGAEVTVFLGTWCSDSRRELARLWRALDEAGVATADELPFHLEYIGVDRRRQEPTGHVDGADLRFVPTFVVRRGGHEVGRIVESSPHGVERDLLDLLTGEASGVLSTRADLGGGAS